MKASMPARPSSCAKLAAIIGPHVSAEDTDASLFEVVQTQEKRRDGRLPCPRRSHERDPLSPADAERNVLEDGDTGLVAERDAVERDDFVGIGGR